MILLVNALHCQYVTFHILTTKLLMITHEEKHQYVAMPIGQASYGKKLKIGPDIG